MKELFKIGAGIDLDIPEVARLWILRILMSLGMSKKFVGKNGFEDDALAYVLGLEEYLEKHGNDFDRSSCLAKLKHEHTLLESKSKRLALPECLKNNLCQLRQLVGLNETETSLLAFAVLLKTIDSLETVTEYLGNLTTIKMIRHLSTILNLPEQDVKTALGLEGGLNRSGLLRVDKQYHNASYKLDLLSNNFADTLVSADTTPTEYLKGVIALSTPAELRMTDYDHISEFIAILQPYMAHSLKTSRKGVNILIHGAPGTGKSQFVKAFTQSIGYELFDIPNVDDEGDSVNGDKRLRAYSLAQNLFAKRKAILLFDEIEDVFASENPFFGKKSTAQSRKGWMNKALEDNAVPAFWVSNSIREIDPAFIRRFDMVFELPIPSKAQRKKIIEQSCSGWIEADTIKRISESEHLSPAVVARASAVMSSIKKSMPQEQLAQSFVRLINNTLRAQNHPQIKKNDANRLPEFYNAALTNADVDLVQIATGVKQAGSARICLYGPSGTGKTAYGRWLAEYLCKPLIVKKVSDLQSIFIGETEINIALAFEKAELEGAVLMIDEVDSFLQDRRNAMRSWEVTQVNEMLTQIESYSGVLIVSTNLMGCIDQAALRRFDLKAKFDYLNAEQSSALLNKYIEQLKLAPSTETEHKRLHRLKTLTPGDFAAVQRQTRFHPLKCAAEFIEALTGECGLKEASSNGIGFYK